MGQPCNTKCPPYSTCIMSNLHPCEAVAHSGTPCLEVQLACIEPILQNNLRQDGESGTVLQKRPLHCTALWNTNHSAHTHHNRPRGSTDRERTPVRCVPRALGVVNGAMDGGSTWTNRQGQHKRTAWMHGGAPLRCQDASRMSWTHPDTTGAET